MRYYSEILNHNNSLFCRKFIVFSSSSAINNASKQKSMIKKIKNEIQKSNFSLSTEIIDDTLNRILTIGKSRSQNVDVQV